MFSEILKPHQCPSSTNNSSAQSICRIFQLQEGETVSLKAVPNLTDFMYLAKGEIRYSQGDVVTQVKAPWALLSPKAGKNLIIDAETDALIYHVDREKMDYLISWAEIAATFVGDDEQKQENLLAKLLDCPTLRVLPASSLYQLVSRMSEQDVVAGEEIIKQGEKGETFYFIESGQAEVWQTGLYDSEPKRVATLDAGATFGEDALVTGGTRNATVKMISDGRVLVATQDDFAELIAKPGIKEVDAEMANMMKDKDGYVLVDVRYAEEREESYIDGSVSIPLPELRTKLAELDKDQQYIAYCRSGNRSAVAALIMHRAGFDAVSMAGGMRNWPYDTKSAW